MSQIRLTLRTLLAYLDDTLPVSESQVIGAKLSENPETQELAERIKKVIRKRSLPVPSGSSDGSPADPNTVAEYLSDALKTELVAKFETACLEQDMHLAEVSACHQILTLVLCEQVHIPPTARQRMYQLVKGRESIPNRKPSTTMPSILEEFDTPGTEESDMSLLMGLQGYQKGDSWKKFGFKIGLVGVLLALFAVALILALPPSRSPETSAPYAVLTQSPSTSLKRSDSPPSKSVPTSKATEPTPPTGSPATAKPIDTNAMPTPAPVSPDMPPPANPPIPNPVPMPTDPPPKLNPPKKDLVPPIPEPNSKDRVQLGKTEDPKVIVVKKNALANMWVRILPEDPMFISTDRVMALPGYKAKLNFDSEVTVELWGNLPELSNTPVAEAAITPYLPGEGFDVDVQVHTGRLYLSTKKKAGAKIALRFRSELWEVKLKDDKSEVVFELFNLLVPGTLDTSRAVVGLFVIDGQASLKDRYQPEVAIQKGGDALWDSKEGQTRVTATQPANMPAERRARATALARLPLYPASARPTLQVLGEFAQQLTDPKQVRAVFDSALSERPDQPVNDQVRAAGRVAILTFAALGDASGLGDSLNDPSRGLYRQSAAIGLRTAIANDAKFTEAFRQVLVEKNRVGDEAADQILQLLRGVSPRQRALAETFDRLLAGLGSNSVAVRELSFELLATNYLQPDDKNIQALLSFDAGAPPDIRNAAITAWTKRAEELKTRAAEPPKEGK
jgi:hypothetical protein